MALINYNGIVLPYVNITQFSQRALLDDSRTDWYCTEFDIQAQCVLNTAYMSIYLGAAPGGTLLSNPAAMMNVLRTTLLRPRRSLRITFNNVDLIPLPPGTVPGTVDAQNGPKPQSCDLIQMSDTTFLLMYHITAAYWEKNQYAGINGVQNQITNNPVLYNRWSEIADIDSQNYTRRTRQGKIVIRSDNNQGWVADQVRSQMAVVGVPSGFLRDKANYMVSPDGLALQYTIVDREVYKLPPTPAFRAEGEYTEFAPNYGSPMRFGRVRVKLFGSNNKIADQYPVLNVAVTVAMAKLQVNRTEVTVVTGGVSSYFYGGFIIKDASVTTSMWENWVEVNITALYTTTDKEIVINTNYPNTKAVAIAALTGKQIPGNSTVSRNNLTGMGLGMVLTPISDEFGPVINTPKYNDRGSAGLLLQTAAYYDPSLTLAQEELTSTPPSAPAGGVGNPLTPIVTPTENLGAGLQPGQAGAKREP